MARILVADDETADRTLVDAVLRSAGYQVLSVVGGSSGIEAVRSRPFDLVITDVAMPEGTGLELIREIREGSEDLPVIVISGFAPEYLERAEELGASFVLSKPVEPDSLLEVVTRALAPTVP
jgi:CheY-like chemotaxis protein